jgi:hypothetical protein
MNASVSPLFRGARALEPVIERMKPLADWLQSFGPHCKVMTISRRDLDTLRRYPEAASTLHNVVTSAEGVTYWRGFELRAKPTTLNPKPQIRP